MQKAINHLINMSSIPFREKVITFISLACLFLFSYTAISKIIEHDTFVNGLSDVKLIGPYATYISWAVPVLEIITAVLLVIPKTLKYGLNMFLVLMTGFTIYISSVLLWAKMLPCSCGGVIEKLTWSQHLWFNMVFISIALYGLWLIKNNSKSRT
jgi:hypothetical protein